MANLIKISGGSNASIQGKALFNATPTYNIGRSLSAVNEGSSVTFTLSTTNVSNGTVLPYTISGISANDVTTGSLTGSFTVNSGLATATITMSADQLTEGAETATLTLNNAAASNFVVVNDTSVWTPNLISGLQLWLDASDTSTLYNATVGGSLVTTDGSAVARWQDKSGNGRHATQATANSRPIFKTNIKNGKGVVRFDGTNDRLSIPSSTSLFNFLNTSSSTIFAIVKNSGSTNTYNFWVFLDNCGTGGGRGSYIGQIGPGAIKSVNHAAFSAANTNCFSNGSTASINQNAFSLVSFYGNPSATPVANRSTGYINGGNQFANNTSTAAAGTGNAYRDLTIGGQSTGAQQAEWNGDITEILIYNTALTTIQRQAVETYLNSKWALY